MRPKKSRKIQKYAERVVAAFWNTVFSLFALVSGSGVSRIFGDFPRSGIFGLPREDFRAQLSSAQLCAKRAAPKTLEKEAANGVEK